MCETKVRPKCAFEDYNLIDIPQAQFYKNNTSHENYFHENFQGYNLKQDI